MAVIHNLRYEMGIAGSRNENNHILVPIVALDLRRAAANSYREVTLRRKEVQSARGKRTKTSKALTAEIAEEGIGGLTARLRMDLIIRFVIGGLVVSLFSLILDLFKPKTFAGLFGAAPSIALATLMLTVGKQGKAFAATEAHSMVIGAIACSSML